MKSEANVLALQEDFDTKTLQTLEAYLFSQGQEVSIEKLAKLLEEDTVEVEKYINYLNLKYQNNNHSLKVIVYEDKVRLGINNEIKDRIDDLQEEKYNKLTNIIDEFIYILESEGIKENTIYNYQLFLTKFIKAVGKDIVNITLQDIRIYLMKEKRNKDNSNRTINRKKTILSGFFHWLEDENRINENPARKLKKAKEKGENPNPFSHEQIERLRDAADSKLFDRMLVEVLYSSGIRISEAEHLNWSDIDFAEQVLRVRNGKGGKDRVTFLSTKAVMLLKEYKQNRTDNKEYVFRSRHSKRMSRSSLFRHIKKVGNRARMNNDETDNVKPHRFRHSFASHLLESGMELHKVQALLGHADPATTQVYARTNQADVEHSYRKVFH